MSRTTLRQIANIVAVVGVIAFNFASQAIPLNGQTNAEIANRFPDLFYFPANYAFSIWGVIYTFLGAFMVYQALPSQRDNPILKRIGFLFFLTSIWNIGWLAAFHYEQFALSMVMMALLLVNLIVIYVRIGAGTREFSWRDRWLIQIPFSLYLGWITAATVVNAAFVLTASGVSAPLGIANETWAVIMFVVTAIIAGGLIFTRRDVAYGLVIVWALSAIASRYQGENALVTNGALVITGIVVVMVVIGLIMTFTNRTGGGQTLTPSSATA